MTADLSPLSDVSEAWQKMGERFGELAVDYGKHIQRALANGNWQGQAFGAQQGKSTATASEYEAAKKEALAVASLLKEAHAQLTRLQKAVKDLVVDAETKNYKVDGSGKATYTGFDNLSAQEQYALHHDPDYPALMADARQKEQGWTEDIAKAVQAVDETDQSVRRALTRAASTISLDGRGGLSGFNAHAEGDLSKAGKPDEPVTAMKTDGLDTGVSVSGPKYGKEASAKAYADLVHVTAKGSLTDGPMKLTGIADANVGYKASANVGITNKGITGKAEASVGARALAEGRAEYGHVGIYGRGDGFAGGESQLSLGVGPEGLNAGGKVFAGAKGSVAGGAEIAGIGAGGTAEGWAGLGVEGKVTFGKGEDGKFHIAAKGGVALGLGGSLGAEFTVDPAKVSNAVSDAAEAVGDAADEVGDAASSVLKHTVTSWL
ncbi:hypothetical protein [Streptomyces violascens]|uniref:hypothetical protein n=1 Tax=Streptomyces violascens TaxID=67381 RepID=UPI00364A8E19